MAAAIVVQGSSRAKESVIEHTNRLVREISSHRMITEALVNGHPLSPNLEEESAIC